MKAAISASQFRSRYPTTTAASSAIVNAILVNSPKKKVIGLIVPGFLVPMYKRKAKTPLGTTQHNPPSSADMNPWIPATKPATTAAKKVVASWIKTKLSMMTFWSGRRTLMCLRKSRLRKTGSGTCSAKPSDYKGS